MGISAYKQNKKTAISPDKSDNSVEEPKKGKTNDLIPQILIPVRNVEGLPTTTTA
jgi:hypothetical protein